MVFVVGLECDLNDIYIHTEIKEHILLIRKYFFIVIWNIWETAGLIPDYSKFLIVYYST